MQTPQLRYTTDQAPTILRYHNSARVGADGVERATKLRGIGGPPGSGKSVGCLKGSVEFFCRDQAGVCRWVRLDEYEIGMEVLQATTTGITSFVKPQRYVAVPATEWITVSQEKKGKRLLTVCPDHRIPLIAVERSKIQGQVVTKQAREWFEGNKAVSTYRMLDTFTLPNMRGIPHSDAIIRTLVMAQADGHYPSNKTNKCELGFVKERKIQRCKNLLDAAEIPYTVRYKAYKPDPSRRVTIISAHLPEKIKEFPTEWHNATQSQAELIADECLYWDGHRGADEFYSTCSETSARFIHHCMSVGAGRSYISVESKPNRTHADNFRVYRIRSDSRKRNLNIRKQNVAVSRTQAVPGELRYCFTVPSGYFLCRDGDSISITGNCAVEHLHFLAQRQEADNQGRRRTKVAIIRSTYRKLQRTTHKTVTEWVMPGSGTIPNTAPMRGELNYAHPSGDGTTVNVIVEFMAIETLDDLQNMDSLEVSSIYINEANEQLEQIISASLERVGRYPPPKDGVKCTEPCVSVDFNLPGKEHWLHKLFVDKDIEENEFYHKSDIEYFEQPAAVLCPNYREAKLGIEEPIYQFNPNAENLANLPEGYYGGQLATNSWPRIQSRLMMQWVTPNTGKRIHDDFKGQFHKSPVPIPIERGATVYVGFDTSGQNKGFSFCQYIEGQVRVLREAFHDGGTVDAIDKVLKPMLAEHFPQCPVMIICDPANPKDDHTSVTATSLLKSEGYNAITAPGNNKLQGRINAVSTFLKRVQGFIVSPEATMIIAGFETQYVYKLDANATKTLGKMVYTNQKQDNDWAHYVDATQNVCLYLAKSNHLTQQNAVGMVGRGTIRPKRVM